MKIDATSGTPDVPNPAVNAVDRVGTQTQSPAGRITGAEPQPTRSDRVELSAQGRALAEGSSLTPDRIHQIRQNILQGAYDSADVVDKVAQSILKSGDI
jgi:anti-sigma28 factor (negative regulator of flagellin synthesis)